MDLQSAQSAFSRLLDTVRPADVAPFLQWVADSFETVGGGGGDAEGADEQQASATLMHIAGELRPQVSLSGGAAGERLHWPADGYAADCKPETTAIVDSFLYDDDDVDELVRRGKLTRAYCKDCGSKNTAELEYVSHSLSREQLRYVFTALLPPEEMRGRSLLDVGSRLGAVLYAAHVFSAHCAPIVGVELDAGLCRLQAAAAESHALDDRVQVVCADVRRRPDLIRAADVLVANNVFQFFVDGVAEQADCWRVIRANMKAGALLVTVPDMHQLTDHLELGFSVDEWLTQVDAERTAAAYAGSDGDKFDDLKAICLYKVN